MGKEYPLALDLIDIVKTGQFNAIPWLANEMNISKSYYRTSCLAIAKLLYLQKEILRPQLDNDRDEVKRLNAKIKEIEQEISNLAEQLKANNNEIHEIELKYSDFTSMTLYKQTKSKIKQLEEETKLKQNRKRELENKTEHLKYKSQKLRHYIKYCDDKTVIVDAINSLIGVYNSFDKDSYGNIAFLCTLVYYAILDKAQMQSFVDWAERNGINKITEPDDLSKDAPANLIKMFEKIYQAKKNEIFISMQFGDSQSELIYEKIVRAVEKFNAKHKSIHLNATPIRIDRTVESSTFSIQDRILEAIKSCSLIIADLSSANINVYHEIGYAMGVAESHNMIPNDSLI